MLGGVQPQSRFQHLAPCAKVILLSGRKDAKPQGPSCREEFSKLNGREWA